MSTNHNEIDVVLADVGTNPLIGVPMFYRGFDRGNGCSDSLLVEGTFLCYNKGSRKGELAHPVQR